MVNKKRLIKLTQKLIRINSENPGANEYQLARFVKGYLERLGVGARIYEFQKRRSNIIAIVKGRESKRSLLLSPHLDTVPAGNNWKFDPFGATIEKGKIYGRGATDDKGNLAAALEAINSIIEDGLRLDYDLLFAATADEESGSKLGLIPLIDRRILKPDCALILDASEFKIVIAQKGLIHFKVKLEGKKAHGAYPWRGKNAIDMATKIISDIKRHKFQYKPHPLLRPPTVNIGTIRGGDRVNVVADWCEFELDIRYLPGTSQLSVLNKVKKIIKKHAKRFKIEIQAIQKSYAINRKHPLVNSLVKTMNNLKIRPLISGSEGATVMTLLQDKNIPALAFGCGSSGQSHNSDEYIKLSNLVGGAKVLEDFLKNLKIN